MAAKSMTPFGDTNTGNAPVQFWMGNTRPGFNPQPNVAPLQRATPTPTPSAPTPWPACIGMKLKPFTF